MATVKELYTAHRIAANGTLTLDGIRGIGGFIADASGTLTLTIDGTVMLTVGVTAGVYLPLPISVKQSVTAALSGSAAGCFLA